MRGRVGSFTGVPLDHNGEFMRYKGLRAMASTFSLSDALLLFCRALTRFSSDTLWACVDDGCNFLQVSEIISGDFLSLFWDSSLVPWWTGEQWVGQILLSLYAVISSDNTIFNFHVRGLVFGFRTTRPSECPWANVKCSMSIVVEGRTVA